MRVIKFLKSAFVGLSLAVGISQFAAAQVGAGTYTGTYSGADRGSISITIDQYGAVSCTLSSAAGNGTYTGKGGVVSQSPFIFTCDQHNFPNYLSVTGNGTAGETLSGQYLVRATTSTSSLQGNFSVSFSGSGNGGSNTLSPQAISGLWYDPAFSGTGFNFLAANNGFFATYYGRDAGGSPLWLISIEVPVGSLKTNTEYTTVLGTTINGTFSSPSYQVAEWGQLTVKFDSCTSAKATLSGKDGTQNLNLQRLGGIAGVTGC
ncbi:hypothetical protein HNP33_002090 [Comamonas odontotermitis]|uniref:Secreted protein n=1 Tax=Comamonas odontotermitis TaxID=379895 RepID=A0ABR6RFS4_9BURK|nr:hypothetical protein [Comamonas odontotermitis]MBB6578022.1 hypothetical protein [Comamonas odontotermitis]